MVRNNLEIENANIIFRNFSGEENQFNRKGNRNFSVLLSEEDALKLANDGWNVKSYTANDGAETIYHLPVKVSYAKIPPCVWLITKRKRKTLLNERTIGSLDYADILSADIIIRPYNWDVTGKTGVKAYLKTAYITIQEDRFAAKYAEEEFPDEDDDEVPFDDV